MVLPSTTACLTWFIATLLMYSELKGWISDTELPEIRYREVAPFIFGMNLCAIICFTLVHELRPRTYRSELITSGETLEMCEKILTQYRWILWVCVGAGLTLFIYFLSLGIKLTSFSDYRIMALTVEKVGYAALAKRIGGHIGVLGAFYLFILGYKQAQTELDFKEFLKCILMYACVNLSVGGRAWLIASLLPYACGFFLGNSEGAETNRTELKKLGMVFLIAISSFSILGNLRSEASYQKSFLEKFLYYTDGPKMANLVLNTFPTGTYDLEYGQANFMSFIKTSEMTKSFNASIKDDIGLSVTVRSTIPALYYDFGYTGGIIMWGILCGLLEWICLNLRDKGTLFSLLLFSVCAIIPFQSPIGGVFVLAMPSFEWLFLLWILRKYIFTNYIPKLIPYHTR